MELDFDDILKQLSAAGIHSPRLEARLLLEKAPDEKALKQMLQERLKHKPLDKILGQKEFYKYVFKVNTDVLSPRPDTETLVEAAIEIIKNQNIQNVLELGVGSGCILLSVLAEFAHLKGVGIDISKPALRVAAENVASLKLEERCQLLEADWTTDSFCSKLPEKFDLVISNPPYIPTAEISLLDSEVRCYDPQIALDGGKDGLMCYRQISSLAPKIINDGGFLILEAGIHQADDIVQIVQMQGLALIAIKKDLSGIKRCIIFQKKDCNR